MHTEYTKCGETVNRGYDRSSYFPDQTMGEPNIKEPDDCVDGYLDAAFKDKGYSLKRIEVPKEQIERKLNTYYTEDDRVPKDLPPAGLETKFGGNVKDMLSTYYGWGRKTQRSELGPDPNTKNDTSVIHGYKPKINDVKPGYLGGPRSGGDLENYVRIIE